LYGQAKTSTGASSIFSPACIPPDTPTVDAGDYADTAVHDGGSDALIGWNRRSMESLASSDTMSADLGRLRVRAWYQRMATRVFALVLVTFSDFAAVDTLGTRGHSVAVC